MVCARLERGEVCASPIRVAWHTSAAALLAANSAVPPTLTCIRGGGGNRSGGAGRLSCTLFYTQKSGRGFAYSVLQYLSLCCNYSWLKYTARSRGQNRRRFVHIHCTQLLGVLGSRPDTDKKTILEPVNSRKRALSRPIELLSSLNWSRHSLKG